MSATFDIVDGMDGLARLRREWTDLLDASSIASPFLTWEWMSAWWQCYGEGVSSRRLAVVTARHDGELVGLLPGYLRRVSTLGVERCEFALLGTEIESTDYLQAIEAPGGPTLLPALVAALLDRERSIDVVVLDNVLANHAVLATAEGLAGRAGYSFESELHRTCPYLQVQGGWEDYVATLSPKMRKNVRRSMRQVVDAGGEFLLVSDPREVAGAVSELFELHARRFLAKNETTGFRADLRQRFHIRVSQLFLEREILRLFRVRMEGRTIAALYCFEFANELFYFQSGIDPAWDKLSVGTALVGHAIKYAFDQQLTRFDFMRGSEEYKFRWTNTVRDIVVARMGTSRRGRAALAVRRQGLKARRLAKRILKPEPRAASPVLTT